MLGTVLVGNARQLTGGVLVGVLASSNGFFFLFADMLPGSVPLGVPAAVLELRGRRTRGPSPYSQRPRAPWRSTAQPRAVQPMEA